MLKIKPWGKFPARSYHGGCCVLPPLPPKKADVNNATTQKFYEKNGKLKWSSEKNITMPNCGSVSVFFDFETVIQIRVSFCGKSASENTKKNSSNSFPHPIWKNLLVESQICLKRSKSLGIRWRLRYGTASLLRPLPGENPLQGGFFLVWDSLGCEGWEVDEKHFR